MSVYMHIHMYAYIYTYIYVYIYIYIYITYYILDILRVEDNDFIIFEVGSFCSWFYYFCSWCYSRRDFPNCDL